MRTLERKTGRDCEATPVGRMWPVPVHDGNRRVYSLEQKSAGVINGTQKKQPILWTVWSVSERVCFW